MYYDVLCYTWQWTVLTVLTFTKASDGTHLRNVSSSSILQVEKNLLKSKAGVAMPFWFRSVAGVLEIEVWFPEELRLPMTGDCILLRVLDFMPQPGYNDFNLTWDESC